MATSTTEQQESPPQEAASLGPHAGLPAGVLEDVRRDRADAQLHAWVEAQVAGGLGRRTACRLGVLVLCVRGVQRDAGFLLGAAAHVEAALLDPRVFAAAGDSCVGADLERVWRVLAGCVTGVSSERCLELARMSRRRGLAVVAP